MKVVSYYTPPYRDDALRLIASLDGWGIAHEITPLPSQGSWIANCGHKSRFMADCREAHAGPIVWLDADAEVVQYPTAFDVLDGVDIAVHLRHGTELLSGTLYLGDTDRARQLLRRWVLACEQNPHEFDQRCLHKAMGSVPGLVVHHLPAAYTCIFDASDMLKQGDPVILHHQASRRLKRLA